jgi:hypothetical protein
MWARRQNRQPAIRRRARQPEQLFEARQLISHSAFLRSFAGLVAGVILAGRSRPLLGRLLVGLPPFLVCLSIRASSSGRLLIRGRSIWVRAAAIVRLRVNLNAHFGEVNLFLRRRGRRLRHEPIGFRAIVYGSLATVGDALA